MHPTHNSHITDLLLLEKVNNSINLRKLYMQG